MFLIVVGAHLKWMEVLGTKKQATSEVTIEKMREFLAIHGLPDCMVSDNGPNFTGSAFIEFLACNGICHIRVAPYYPASNGVAERAVKTFKSSLRKQRVEHLTLKLRGSCYVIVSCPMQLQGYHSRSSS